MDEEKFILVSLEESRSKEISEVLGSKTCKKIMGYLSENKEASQKDLSDQLKIPMNTLDYNMKKLLSSGIIQKRKNFFWSKKGKKIVMYELSNKSIVISPKKSVGKKIKSVIPAVLISAAGTFAIWVYENLHLSRQSLEADSITNELASGLIAKAEDIAPTLISYQPTPAWTWFLIGTILTIIVLLIANWRKL